VSGEYVGLGSVTDPDGWFPTKDLATIDDDGYLFVEGRLDDTIIRGGENISPADIEDVILRHPDVAECAVVGVPDEEWGQRLAVVVVPSGSGNLDAVELLAWLGGELRSSKTPDEIRVWMELPHTETGKILRRRVLEQLIDEPSGQTAGGVPMGGS
jgi:acyl-CoA synthetase (AMP-forming)/AMP-acid ligase II